MGKFGLACFAAVSILMSQIGEGTAVFASVTIREQDVALLTDAQLTALVEKAVDEQKDRLVKINTGTSTFEIPRHRLGLNLEVDISQVVDQLKSLQQFNGLIESSLGDISLPTEFILPLAYEEGLVDKWIRAVKRRADDPMVEHGIVLLNGQFQEVEGKPGQELSKSYLKNQLLKTLPDMGKDPIVIKAEKREIRPIRDKDLLGMVNAKISSFSSYFPLYQEGRTQNVRIAASRIDKLILMPGDEFSYSEEVAPVTTAEGYRYATIFMNGQPVSGIGGGICQVSSTLYNAQLKAGIKPTERMNHSLIVDYVPRGQDATVAEGYIDYRFVNTLDYPIYIHATTDGGTLTIEFWSNEDALNGITYLPRTVFKGLTGDGRRKYDTILYGYNKDGELVYEEFLHRSLYKQKN